MNTAEKITNLKTPPHSIEAEQSVLAALMSDGSRWDYVSDLVDTEDFYRKEHRLIFQAMTKQQGRSIDVVTISETLADLNQLHEAGGIEYLAELASALRGSTNVTAYARIVRERAVLRSLISVAHGIADSGYNPNGRESAEILTASQSALAELEAGRGEGEPQQVDSAIKASVNALDYRCDNKGKIHGLETGFKDLDAALLGLVDGDLIIVAGRPSMGKTTLACNFAENVAMSGKPVIVFSLEMSERKLCDRMLCSIGKVDAKKYRSGELPQEDMDRVCSAAVRLRGRPLYIDDSSLLTSAQLLGRARRAARRMGQKPALVVVDYLQILRDKGDGVERVTRISANLKQLARELNCPVVALSQLNRGVESRPDKRPLMSDLRDSGSVEQDADIILMLYRDEVYNENTMYKGIADCLIRKNRDGEIGTVRLSAPLHRNRFETLAPGFSMPVDNEQPKRKGFEY